MPLTKRPEQKLRRGCTASGPGQPHSGCRPPFVGRRLEIGDRQLQPERRPSRRADWELARLGVTGCRRGAGSAETPGPERCVPRPLGRAPREVNYATVSCSWGLSGPPLYFPLLKPAENRRRFIICPNRVINVLCHNGTIQIPQLIKYLRQTFKPDLRGEHMTMESSVSTPGAHTAWRLPVINSHMLSGAGNAKPKITVTLSPRHVFLLR